MIIQPVEEGHLAALSGLYRELTGAESDPDKMAATYALIRGNPQYHLIGAFDDDGRLVGTAMGIVCYDLVKSCRPFVVVENVVVAEASRGKGVGKALMLELERIAVSYGCSYAILVSGAHRVEAHQFYYSLGYGPGHAVGFKKQFM